jgi:hypothetical protein
MLRTLLLLTVLGSLAGASVAHADPIFAVDVIVQHDVTWDYRAGDTGDRCDPWKKGSGTQRLRIHSDRRERMRLEHAFGSTLLTGVRSPTFVGSVNRVGKWQENTPPVAGCSPCGPNSEFGLCGPEPTPPTPPKFDCGEREARGPMVTLGYQKTKGIPSLAKGMQVRGWVNPSDYFPACPPQMPGGRKIASLKYEWPQWAKLPTADTARIARLKVGDSVVAEVKQQRTYVDDAGQVVRGEDCIRMPDIKEGGYSECAVTEYAVTFTRLS